MPLHFYITLGIFSSWLIFGVILCYRVSVYDMSFDFIVVKASKRVKYGMYMLFCLLFSYYIFCIRLSRVGKMFDIYEFFTRWKQILSEIFIEDIILMTFFLVLLIIFWILLLRCIYQHLKKCILALYLYYHQYSTFRDKCYTISKMYGDYYSYLYSRVWIFTENAYILGKSRIIWPIGSSILERNIFHGLIPYLVIFDILTQHGQISKIFIIMPWFYVYTLIRSFFVLFEKVDIPENWELSEKLYGFYGYDKEFKW